MCPCMSHINFVCVDQGNHATELGAYAMPIVMSTMDIQQTKHEFISYG
jgi:hypothetical protein